MYPSLSLGPFFLRDPLISRGMRMKYLINYFLKCIAKGPALGEMEGWQKL